MRMKLRLLNVSSELLFSGDVGNLPVTYGVYCMKKGFLFIRYPKVGKGCLLTSYQIWHTASRGTDIKRVKAHPTIHIAYYFRKLGIA
jgi:hypothetical protein